MVSHIFILTQDLNNLILDALESQFKFRSKEEIFNLTATVTIKPIKNRERLILLSLNMIHAAMKTQQISIHSTLLKPNLK